MRRRRRPTTLPCGQTVCGWGAGAAAPVTPTYVLTRRLFTAALGLIYFVAFTSIFVQLEGLYSENGLLPVSDVVSTLNKQSDSFSAPSLVKYHRVFGLDVTACLTAVVLAGMLVSATVSFGYGNAPLLAICFALYLSVYSVGQTFMSFQWDVLLLETGFVGIFFAPNWHSRSRLEPSHAALWCLRLILFKLMLMSGLVKLQSHGPTWLDLSALQYHFATQCIPTPLAWYAHFMHPFLLKAAVAATFLIEIPATFLILLPFRATRLLACGLQVLLQLLILATGNYTFFNWLTIALALTLLDDGLWVWLRQRHPPALPPPAHSSATSAERKPLLPTVREAEDTSDASDATKAAAIDTDDDGDDAGSDSEDAELRLQHRPCPCPSLCRVCPDEMPQGALISKVDSSRRYTCITAWTFIGLLILVAFCMFAVQPRPLPQLAKALEVSGAEVPAVNGRYSYRGEWNDAPLYIKPPVHGHPEVRVERAVSTEHMSTWHIRDSKTIYYYADSVAKRPPAVNWHADQDIITEPSHPPLPPTVHTDGLDRDYFDRIDLVLRVSADSIISSACGLLHACVWLLLLAVAALTASEVSYCFSRALYVGARPRDGLLALNPHPAAQSAWKFWLKVYPWCRVAWAVARALLLTIFMFANFHPFRDTCSNFSKASPGLESWSHELLRPYAVVNGYGLFRDMTGVGKPKFDPATGEMTRVVSRPEIIIEGSFGPGDCRVEPDTCEWMPYEFPYKPGDVSRSPPWVAPHQPRLDWQMWFAALEPTSRSAGMWFHRLMDGIVGNSSSVLHLLGEQGIPADFRVNPPTFLRGRRFLYTFAPPSTVRLHQQAGDDLHEARRVLWWERREPTDYTTVHVSKINEPRPLHIPYCKPEANFFPLWCRVLTWCRLHAVGLAWLFTIGVGFKLLSFVIPFTRVPWLPLCCCIEFDRRWLHLRTPCLFLSSVAAVMLVAYLSTVWGLVLFPLVITSLTGLLLSFYMYQTEQKLYIDALERSQSASRRETAPYKPLCDIDNHISCSKVSRSPYSRLCCTIPNSVLGMVFYLTFILLSCAYASSTRYWLLAVLTLLALIATIASVLLAYLSFHVVKITCLVCNAVYIVNVALFAVCCLLAHDY